MPVLLLLILMFLTDLNLIIYACQVLQNFSTLSMKEILLFSICLNHLGKDIKVKVHQYADDTSVYPFAPSAAQDELKLCV